MEITGKLNFKKIQKFKNRSAISLYSWQPFASPLGLWICFFGFGCIYF